MDTSEQPAVDTAVASSSMEPMKVQTQEEHELSASGKIKEDLTKWSEWFQTKSRLPRKYRLVTDKNARMASIWTVRFTVLCSAINTKMLNPNYPIMVSGAHPDSFDDTEPFDFNSATYFIPMMSLLGVAISSVFVGQISDRVGRKRVMFVLSAISGVGSIVKYLARDTFWGFCIANLVFGFFLSNLPVAMAYAGDVFTTQAEKQNELGIIVGSFVTGNAGGGIIAILMFDSGLFAPLWVGAGLMFFAAVLNAWYMIEPGDIRMLPIGKASVEEVEEPRPETIDQKKMWNIVLGALCDNIGSTALFPMCLSPLALEQYTLDFITADPPEDPIMTITGYQWLSVCVAFMVVPSTKITPWVFKRRGVAGTCVLGNFWTACLTIALLAIGNGPATTAAFAGFVTVLYAGYPVTVFSQLSTGPMLDVIAPEDKIGFVQGLNNSSMNFGMAFAPWVFGLLADAAGTNTSIWIGIGISFLAALVNFPLTFHKEFGKPQIPVPPAKRVLPGEDEELVEKALQGEYIPPQDLFAINHKRALEKKSLIVPKVKSYKDEKDSLDDLLSRAKETFEFRKDTEDRILAAIAEPDNEEQVKDLCGVLNKTKTGSPEIVDEATGDLGNWIGDYLKDNGYFPHVNSVMIKQMILTAFPTITREEEFTPENIEEALLRQRQVMNEYLAEHKDQKLTWNKIMGTNGGQLIYS